MLNNEYEAEWQHQILTLLGAGAAQKLFCIKQIQERKAERAFESLN